VTGTNTGLRSLQLSFESGNFYLGKSKKEPELTSELLSDVGVWILLGAAFQRLWVRMLEATLS